MKKAYLFGIFILLLTLLVVTQLFYDQNKAKAKYSEPFVMSSKLVRHIDIGLHNAASDLFWLEAIQYFGGWNSKNNEKLGDYLDASIELDPKFSYPYAFGVLILPSLEKRDKAIEIGKRGTELNLPDWRIPYYLATIYYIDLNDQTNAAIYFDKAARTKDAPENIARVAAQFGAKSTKRSQTITIWQGIYENTKDEVVKERAKNYIIHLKILDYLDQAVQAYKDRFGLIPKDLNELVQKKIIAGLPIDPFGFTFTVNEEGTVSLKQ